MHQWYTSIGISENQWKFYRHWLILLLAAETIMLIFNDKLFEIYWFIALAFSVGFLLRVFRLYPGEKEPLILDFSAVAISIAYAYMADMLISSPWRFLFILCSSAILLPHFIFIAQEK